VNARNRIKDSEPEKHPDFLLSIDPALASTVANLDAEQRRELAREMARRATLIETSAALMDGGQTHWS
jgi:hypothetical protein